MNPARLSSSAARRVSRHALRDLLGQAAILARRAITNEHGVALPPFIDHHVHLHLIDTSTLPEGGIAGVVDLGGDPVDLARRPHDGNPCADRRTWSTPGTAAGAG